MAFPVLREIEPERGPSFDISGNTRPFREEAETLKGAFSDGKTLEFDKSWTTEAAREKLDEILVRTEGREWQPHEDAVKAAVARGESIPPEVLAEYPDLQAKPPVSAPKEPTLTERLRRGGKVGKKETTPTSTEIPTVNEIQAQRKKVENLQKKLKRMTAMVPPPIRAETANYLAEQTDKLEKMQQAYRSQEAPREPTGAVTETEQGAAPTTEGEPAAEGRGARGAPEAEPGPAVAAPVGGEGVALPKIERTTPAPGTPERVKLEADHEAAIAAYDETGGALRKLQQEREKTGNTLKGKSLDKKIEKADEASHAAYKESERLREDWYQAQIEDGAEQTENRLFQLVSRLKLETDRLDLDRRSTDYGTNRTKLLKGATPAIRAEVERLAREDEANPSPEVQKTQGKLSPEDDAKVIQRAIDDATEDFIRNPLMAKADPESTYAKDAKDRIGGNIYGKRLQEYQRQAEERVEALVEAGLPRDRLSRDAKTIDNIHDYGRIDEAVKDAEKAAEKYGTETAAKEKADTESRQAAFARFDNPTEADRLARRMVRELSDGQIQQLAMRVDTPELLPPKVKKWVEGIPPETLREAVGKLRDMEDIIRQPVKEHVTWPYEPEKYELRKSDLLEDDRFNGKRGWSTTYQGKPAWTNGHVIEFSEPPKGIEVESKPDVPVDKAIAKGETSALTPIAREAHGEKDTVILRRDDNQAIAVDSKYWDHFATRYSGVKAVQDSANPKGPLTLRQGKKIVGVVMPMLYSPTPTVAGLLERAGTAPKPEAPAGKGAVEAPKPGFGSSNKVFTAEMAEEARQAFKKSAGGSQLSMGLDPELVKAGVKLAGYYIEGGARNFAEFSKRMLDDLGEGVRPYLREWYESVRSDKRIDSKGMDAAEAIGPGAMSPEEARPVKEFTTSMKNAQVDKERQARGELPLFSSNRMSNPEAWDRAMRQIDEDAGVQDRLIEDLEKDPRAATPVENSLLLQRRVSLTNERNSVADQLFRAVEGGFTDRADTLRRRAEGVIDELQRLEEVGRAAGTKSGQSLQARKMMANQDYTLAAMETRKRLARGGEKLTPVEQAEVERLHKKIAELQKALDERSVGKEQKAAEQQAEEATKEITAKVATEVAKEKTAGVKRDPEAERKAILDGMKKAAGDTPVADLRRYVQRLAENYVRGGITERNALIEAVQKDLKEILPEITWRETMDLISGFGDFRPLDPEPAKVKLRDLKGQMQQVAKLETLLARQPVPKTGPERREPSAEERRLMKLVGEYKRRYGVETADTETSLKSALEAVKTRLRHQIEDLDYQIATGKKIIREKTGVAYDPEAQELVKRRDALKAQFDKVFGKPEMTPEQRVKLAIAAVERSIEDLRERIDKGETQALREPSKTPQTPALQAAQLYRDALREHLQELRDLDPVRQEQQRIQAIERAIAEYERRAEAGDFAPSQATPQIKTVAIEAAMKRRDAARAALEAIKESSGYADQQRIQKALASLEKANADLARRIGEGNILPRILRRQTPETPAVKAARMEHDLLSGILKEMRDAARPRKTPDEIALQSLKTRMSNRIAELADKLERGDFETRPRREVPRDAEAQRLEMEMNRIKREFNEELVKDKMKRRTTAQKVIDTTLEVTNLPRLLWTSFDISATFRQGGIGFFSHPIKSAKIMPSQFRAMASEDFAHAVSELIATDPKAHLYARAKLYFSEQNQTLSQMEEQYMSRWAGKIPGVAHSQRAFTTFLNLQRKHIFDGLLHSLTNGPIMRRLGLAGEPTQAELRVLGHYVNVITGRGDMGAKANAAVALNRAFFSPRLVMSRFQYALGEPLWRGPWRGTGRARLLLAGEYARFFAGLAMVYGLARLAGADIGLDPRSSDFGKLIFGETRVDPLAGLSQVITFGTRSLFGEMVTSKGKEIDLRPERRKFGQQDVGSVTGRFLRSKLSPNLGMGYDWITGVDFLGRPVTARSIAERAVTPLSVGDVVDAMTNQGVPKNVGISILALSGMSVQTHGDVDRTEPYLPITSAVKAVVGERKKTETPKSGALFPLKPRGILDVLRGSPASP